MYSAIYNIVNARSIEEDFDLLYSKFSDCDTEFLDKLPGKVEIQDTNIGNYYHFLLFFLSFNYFF